MIKYDFYEFVRRTAESSLDSFFERIVDVLPSLGEGGPWLAGGAVRRVLIGDPLDSSDFDIFFANKEQYESFIDGLKNLGAKKTAENDKNEVWSYYDQEYKKTAIIQLINFRHYSNVEELLDSFDFTITQCAFDGQTLFVGDYTLFDLANRRLALHKLTFGLSTVRRLIKYTKQGYKACSGTIQSILEAIAKQPELIHSDVQYID